MVKFLIGHSLLYQFKNRLAPVDDIFEIVDCKKVWKEVKLEQVIFSVNKNNVTYEYNTKILKGSNIELL